MCFAQQTKQRHSAINGECL